MTFEIHRFNGPGPVVRYAFEGEIDIAVADTVVDELCVARRGPRPLLVDLSRVSFIDSSGLRALLEAAKPASDAQNVTFVRPSHAVVDLLDICGVARMLPIVDDTHAFELPNLN